MYTELKELINFLAIYMHYRIPRRRICLFMESYGNHLAGRFLKKWNTEEPKYGENERTLVIKMGDCLDAIFATIATSIGVAEEDLAACFPSPMLLFCNPGEVFCHEMNCTSVITVWIGDVNADLNYTPMPNGIAFFCETSRALYDVLNDYPFCFGTKNKEAKSQKCILLQLISSMDDNAYDLLNSGFFFENEVPPFLFRYTTKENCSFTARSFAGTRFGCHRSRPDHKAMRRIQQAAAFLAVTSDSNYNTASIYRNQPYANNNFASMTSPSIPLTSAVEAVSVEQKSSDLISSMATSANAIRNAIASNEFKHLFLKPPQTSSKPLPESNACIPGHIANQFYSSSSITETGSDFSSWNCSVTDDIKVDHAKVAIPICDERNNFHLMYSNNSGESLIDNHNPCSFETTRNGTGRSFSNCMIQNGPLSETPSLVSFSESLSNLNYKPSENLEKQIHNLELNNSDIAGLQYNLSQMSFADNAVLAPSTFATNQPKMN